MCSLHSWEVCRQHRKLELCSVQSWVLHVCVWVSCLPYCKSGSLPQPQPVKGGKTCFLIRAKSFDESTVCFQLACWPGSYANGTGNTNCTLCAEGSAMPNSGNAQCLPCESGHAAFGLGNVCLYLFFHYCRAWLCTSLCRQIVQLVPKVVTPPTKGTQCARCVTTELLATSLVLVGALNVQLDIPRLPKDR